MRRLQATAAERPWDAARSGARVRPTWMKLL
jgi:hypothetical protein